MPVKIKGSDYTTVAERLNAIHGKESSKLTILTEILSEDDLGITMKATVKISGDDPQQFEGHARELYSSNRNEVNFAFSLENCETSAIGRALASAGYAGKKFSSAEEMQSIDRKNDAREKQIEAKKKNPGVIAAYDMKAIWELAQEKNVNANGLQALMAETLDTEVKDSSSLSTAQLKKVYDALKAKEVEVVL